MADAASGSTQGQPQPLLGRTATLERLAGALTNAPPAEDDEQPPLRRQSTVEVNRALIEEHRALVAQSGLTSSPCFMVTVVLIVFTLCFGVLAFYIYGWYVLIVDGNKSCDAYLTEWLWAMLLTPFVLRCMKGCCELHKAVDLAPPLLLGIGVYLFSTSETCHETNPNLYNFVHLYIGLGLVCWLMGCCGIAVLVGCVLWMVRNGILDPKPHHAREGLIDDFETVKFDEALFSDDGCGQPMECSICVSTFSEEMVIKRTPCGHYFHESCIGEWIGKYNNNCPLCRQDLEQAIDGTSVAEPADP